MPAINSTLAVRRSVHYLLARSAVIKISAACTPGHLNKLAVPVRYICTSQALEKVKKKNTYYNFERDEHFRPNSRGHKLYNAWLTGSLILILFG